MYISSKPNISLNSAMRRAHGRGDSIFPFNTDRCIFFYTGRYALAAGLKALGMNPGENILMPSYNCWVEIDPVKRQNIEAKYYRIRRDFTADLEDMEAKIDSQTRAICITHYLGFPQPLGEIMDICGRHNILLIEDCAHAFLSDYKEKPLGSFGDVSVFSFRKTLPLPNGAALIINNKDLKVDSRTKEPNTFATLYYLAEGLRTRTTNGKYLRDFSHDIVAAGIYMPMYSLRFIFRLMRKVGMVGGSYLTYPSGNQYLKDLEDWGMSALSKKIIETSDFQKIKEIRRRNFAFFLNYFKDDERVSLPVINLTDGICPLFFPVLVNKRDLLYRMLKERGVAGHDWWGDFHPDVPWGDFPHAEFMKTHILGLPVHQDITLRHLQIILEEFEKAYRDLRG